MPQITAITKLLRLYSDAVTSYLFLGFLSELDACLIESSGKSLASCKSLGLRIQMKLHYAHIWERDSLWFHFTWLKGEQSFGSRFGSIGTWRNWGVADTRIFFGNIHDAACHFVVCDLHRKDSGREAKGSAWHVKSPVTDKRVWFW